MWGLALADFGRDPSSSDSLRGIVFPKKAQKLLIKFPGRATSGRHNYAMITDCRKFTSKWSFYAMSSFHFYHKPHLAQQCLHHHQSTLIHTHGPK